MRVIAYALAAALDRLAEVLDGDTAEAGVHFTCDEADAFAAVLVHSGHGKVAAYWLAMHGADDEDPDPAEGAGERHGHLHQLVDGEFDINWDAARRYVADTFSVASDATPTTPTTLTLGGNAYEVVTAIYVPPLYGDVLPCWVAVLRADGAFVVVTATATPTGFRVEYPTGDLPCRRAHEVAWKRASDRYGLAGQRAELVGAADDEVTARLAAKAGPCEHPAHLQVEPTRAQEDYAGQLVERARKVMRSDGCGTDSESHRAAYGCPQGR